MNLICQAITNLGSGGPDDNEAQANHLVTHSLRAEGFDASEDGTGRGTLLCLTPWDAQGKRNHSKYVLSATLSGSDGKGEQRTQYVNATGVRRLTPTECERLQGFPDGWTCLCQPLEGYDPMKCTCPDGPRYKTLGNAVTVPVLEYLGRMIVEVS